MKHFVMITGASEGLGKSFAIESAKKGMDLFLVSLPNSGLPNLCKLIETNFNVFVDCMELDLMEDQNCIQLLNYVKTKKYPVTFLINNAGIGGNYQFSDENFDVFNRMIQLNIKALTCVTHGMIEILAHQTESYILNVSSIIIFFEGPFKQVYGATKSFIKYFSQSLGIELEDRNIHVSVLCPGGINSNIRQARVLNNCNTIQKISILDPEQVAAEAIENTLKRQKIIIPGKVPNLYFYCSMLFPKQLKKFLIKSNNSKLMIAIKP